MPVFTPTIVSKGAYFPNLWPSQVGSERVYLSRELRNISDRINTLTDRHKEMSDYVETSLDQASLSYATRADAAAAITAGEIVTGDSFLAGGTAYRKTTTTGIDNVFEAEFTVTGVGYVSQGRPFYVNANTFTECLLHDDAFKIAKFAQDDVIVIPNGTKNGQRLTIYFYCDNSDYEEGFVQIEAKGVTRNEVYQIKYRDVTSPENIPVRKGEILSLVWDGPAVKWLIENHSYLLWTGNDNTGGAATGWKWFEGTDGRVTMKKTIGAITANSTATILWPGYYDFNSVRQDMVVTNSNTSGPPGWMCSSMSYSEATTGAGTLAHNHLEVIFAGANPRPQSITVVNSHDTNTLNSVIEVTWLEFDRASLAPS